VLFEFRSQNLEFIICQHPWISVTSYFSDVIYRHFTFNHPTPFHLPTLPIISLSPRPDSSKTLALYKSCTYLLTDLSSMRRNCHLFEFKFLIPFSSSWIVAGLSSALACTCGVSNLRQVAKGLTDFPPAGVRRRQTMTTNPPPRRRRRRRPVQRWCRRSRRWRPGV